LTYGHQLHKHTTVSYNDFEDIDALEEYLVGVPLRQQRPLTFAQEIEQIKPDLAQFIYDMAAIPILSAECERIFSSAKLLLSDQRARMKPGLIEAYECLRHWILGLKEDPFERIPPQTDKEAIAQAERERQLEQAEANNSNNANNLMSDTEDGDSEAGGDDFDGS
jgi:hypothetical protein